MNKLFLICGLCGWFLATPGLAQIPPGYEIVQVTQNPYDEFFPRINNRGQIVFGTGHGSAPEDWEILLYDDGELIQITNDAVYDGKPEINDRGAIVWRRAFGPPTQWGPNYEIVLYENGVLTRLTHNNVEDHSPRINNHGQVTWSRDHLVSACGGPSQDIFMWDQGQVIQITTDAIPEQVVNQSPEINDLGQIVWTRYDFCDPPAGYNYTSKIMMYSGGVITELTAGQFAPHSPILTTTRRSSGITAILQRVGMLLNCGMAGSRRRLSMTA